MRVDLLEEASTMMKPGGGRRDHVFSCDGGNTEGLENKGGCKLDCTWEHLLAKTGAQVVTAEGGWRCGGVERHRLRSCSDHSPLGCPLASLGQRTECSSFPDRCFPTEVSLISFSLLEGRQVSVSWTFRARGTWEVTQTNILIL